MQCGRRNRKWLLRNVSETDLWARLLSSCHSRLTVSGLQTDRPRAAGKQQLYAALEASSVDAHTQTRRLRVTYRWGWPLPKQPLSGSRPGGNARFQLKRERWNKGDKSEKTAWRERLRVREVWDEKNEIMWEIEWKIKQGRQDGGVGGGGGR